MLVVSNLQVQYCYIINNKVYTIANDWGGHRASSLSQFANDGTAETSGSQFAKVNVGK